MRAGRLLLGVMVALVASAALAVPPMQQTVDLDRIPAWVREVAARPAPATDADAAILHDEVIFEPIADGGFRRTERRAVKILRVSQRKDLALNRAYYRKNAPPAELDTWVLYGDGKAVLPDAVRDRVDAPDHTGSDEFNDQRIAALTTPALLPGAVVVFQSSVIEPIDVGGGAHLLGEVDRPTVLARVVLRLPDGWAGDITAVRSEAVRITRVPGAVVAVLENLAAQSRPDIRLDPGRILPLATARWWNPAAKRGFTDWAAVGRWTEDLAAPRLADAAGAREAGAALKPASDAEFLPALERAFAIAGRDVRYASVQLGIGGYQPAAASATFRDRFGDCKAKANLLRALLAPWGAPVYQVLVRTRGEGPLPEDAPYGGPFNHEIAAVKLPPGVGPGLWNALEVEGVGRLLFVDATQPESPYELPDHDQATRALLILPGAVRLVDLPARPAGAHVSGMRLTARIDDWARMPQLEIVLTAGGGAAADLRDRLRPQSAEERRRDLVEDLRTRFGALDVWKDELRGLESLGQPLTRVVAASNAVGGQKIGRLLLLESGRLVPRESLCFLPAEPVPWALDVGTARRSDVTLAVEVPTGMKPESLPAPLHYDDDLLAIDAVFSFEGGVLRYHRSLEVRAITIPPARYAAFRAPLFALRRLETGGIAFVK